METTASAVVLFVSVVICEAQLLATNKTFLPRYAPAPMNNNIQNYNALYRNAQSRQGDSGRIRFEDTVPEKNKQRQYFFNYEEQANPSALFNRPHENINRQTEGPVKITFEGGSDVVKPKPSQKEKEPRRGRPRWPRKQFNYISNPGFSGLLNSQAPAYQANAYRLLPPPGPSPYYPSRPSSVALDALSSVSDALSSIARFDSYHCVPRLLCEAAAGVLGNNNSGPPAPAQNDGLQNLLTLLTSYSSISSSPLFIFGRAAYLGMTSKGNPGACRYAYPLCPTDPEDLIYYLNNYNGGFFRFFNEPQRQQHQVLNHPHSEYTGGTLLPMGNFNLHSSLAGLLRPAMGIGTVRPKPIRPILGPLDPTAPTVAALYGHVVPEPGYGLYYPHEHVKPITAPKVKPTYGLFPGYPNLLSAPEIQRRNIIKEYDNGYGYGARNQYKLRQLPPSNPQTKAKKNMVFLENRKYIGSKTFDTKKFSFNKKIEKRILRLKPAEYNEIFFGNRDFHPKWAYSAVDSDTDNNYHASLGAGNNDRDIRDSRESKKIKFPGQRPITAEQEPKPERLEGAKGFAFPGPQSNRVYRDYKVDLDGEVKTNTDNQNEQGNGNDVVYVVRGDGNPNRPEIFERRPEEKFTFKNGDGE